MKVSTTVLFVLTTPVWLSYASSGAFELEPRGGEDLRNIQEIAETALAIGTALNNHNRPYAIQGGAAVVLLGSNRKTGDVDVYIPAGKKSSTLHILSADPRFTPPTLRQPRMTFTAKEHFTPAKTALGRFLQRRPVPGATVIVPFDISERLVPGGQTYVVRGSPSCTPSC